MARPGRQRDPPARARASAASSGSRCVGHVGFMHAPCLKFSTSPEQRVGTARRIAFATPGPTGVAKGACWRNRRAPSGAGVDVVGDWERGKKRGRTPNTRSSSNMRAASGRGRLFSAEKAARGRAVPPASPPAGEQQHCHVRLLWMWHAGVECYVRVMRQERVLCRVGVSGWRGLKTTKMGGRVGGRHQQPTWFRSFAGPAIPPRNEPEPLLDKR